MFDEIKTRGKKSRETVPLTRKISAFVQWNASFEFQFVVIVRSLFLEAAGGEGETRQVFHSECGRSREVGGSYGKSFFFSFGQYSRYLLGGCGGGGITVWTKRRIIRRDRAEISSLRQNRVIRSLADSVRCMRIWIWEKNPMRIRVRIHALSKVR
jgi:hypothetical protein